ncbi:MAG: TRAP transporter large permease [Pseudomonadales bacterium]
MTTVLFILVLFALIAINVPLGVALGTVAFGALLTTQGSFAVPQAAMTMYEGATSFPLLAIPLFVTAGTLMNTGGISEKLIAFASTIVGFIRGGLAMVNIAVSLFFAEISGSAVADVAATGSILIPAMKKKGYSAPFSAAVTSSSASLAIIIPPSIPMIIYAVMAETSVVQLFVAGVVPGLLGAAGMMGVSYYYAKKHGYPVEDAFDLCEVWRKGKDAFWALTLPIIILGGILGGFVTATEGAAIAVVAALFVSGVIYSDLTLDNIRSALLDGVEQTAVVMLLVASSAMLGLYMTEAQIPQHLSGAILELTDNKYLILALLNILFLLVGCVLHSTAAIVLMVPVIAPVILVLGIDPIHFGIILTLNLAIGQQTPPVASVLMTSSSIAKANIWDTSRSNLPFIGVLITVLLLVTYVPEVSLGLVEYFYR